MDLALHCKLQKSRADSSLGCDHYTLCIHYTTQKAINASSSSEARCISVQFFMHLKRPLMLTLCDRRFLCPSKTTHIMCFQGLACLPFSLSFFFFCVLLRGKPPVLDTLSQSQIGGEVSSSRLNYTGEPRNSSSAETAWTRRKNTPMRVATEQSTRLVLP